MEAGRELDLLVAEHVMGFRRVIDDTHDYNRVQHKNEVLLPVGETLETLKNILPPRGPIAFGYFVSDRYSTDIAAAWQVIKYLTIKYNVMVKVKRMPGSFRAKSWQEWACIISNGEIEYPTSYLAVTEFATTAPHAICLAALKALGVEHKEQTREG